MVKTNVVRFSLVVGLLTLSVALSGCGTTNHFAIVRERGPNGKRVTTHVPITSLPAKSDYLAETAAFSALVYIDVPVATPLDSATAQESEEQRTQLARLAEAGWAEVPDIPRPSDPARRQTPDLTYRLWVNSRTSPAVAILAFRGTHIRPDWYSNLRWFDEWIPNVEDHYEQTERLTPEIVHRIKNTYGPDVTIIATGHSLGGGLAQTAAYAACGSISKVIAFDSSPVTKHRAANACGPNASPKVFYRVFEQSEILSYARFLVRQLLGLKGENPHMVEIKVHLFNGVGVVAHSMQQLAAQLDIELHPEKSASR